MEALQSPLTNLQLELLKLFSRNVSDDDLLQIKRLLVRFFAEKAMDAADKVWDEKGLTEQDAEEMSYMHLRTPYQPKEQ
jgi:hypothetical protein